MSGAKTDKIDAHTLAKLLAGGFLPEVWLPDEQTRILRRRVSSRAQLARQRTRVKNQVHATRRNTRYTRKRNTRSILRIAQTRRTERSLSPSPTW